jgi:hypothetical protein
VPTMNAFLSIEQIVSLDSQDVKHDTKGCHIEYIYLWNHDERRYVRKYGIPRRGGVRGLDGARYTVGPALGGSHGYPEIDVPVRLLSPLQHHVRLAHGIVARARQGLDRNIRPARVSCES